MKKMLNDRAKIKKFILPAMIHILLVILLLLVIRTILYQEPQWKEDIVCMDREAPQSLFLSTYPADNFYEKDFNEYRGIRTKVAHPFEDADKMSKFLKQAANKIKTLEYVYLGLDPQKEENGGDIKRSLVPVIKANPKLTFEILLPAPPLSYWNSMGETDRREVYDKYIQIISVLSKYDNTIVYFMGAQEWLVTNEHNYVNSMMYNDQVALTVMLSTFCDRRYQVTGRNAHEKLDELEQLRRKSLKDTSAYQDGENWAVVFLGDSIIGNYTGSLSVPGVVHNFSGAEVFNCGFGGTNASAGPESNISLPVIVDSLLTGDLTPLPEESQAYLGITEFQAKKEELKEKNLFIVINYGLNDYLKGHPVKDEDQRDIFTYEGAIRTSVESLKLAWPDAVILLMTPTYCTYNSNGTQRIGKKGGKLTDYVDAVIKVSRELSVPYINNYEILGTDLENPEIYLADGCHLNERGRMAMGINIGKTLSQCQETQKKQP